MTITQLEYLVAVDTHKSFAEAAKHCFVTQPTLSMQIKKVEEDLDILIFDRSKKPVLTTDIGKLVISQARVTLKEASRIREIIANSKEQISGTLRVGIIPTLSPYLLPLFITDFIKKYPEISLVVEELLSDEIIRKLNNDLLDVGILVTPLEEKSLIEIPLFYESFVVYMSTKHPFSSRDIINFTDLNIDEMWLLKEGHCFRSQMINICEEKTAAYNNQLKFESGSLETLMRIVETQYGYTLLPELAVTTLNKEKYTKFVRHFKKPRPVREVSLVIHRSFMKRKLINLLQEEILGVVSEKMKNSKRGKLIKWA